MLLGRFAAAAEGHAGALFVVGEPGIGKTRLLQEAAAHAVQEGATFLRGGASESEGMPPYLPFLEALGEHISTAQPDQLREQAGATAAILASILPELRARLGELPPTYPMPAEQARLRLYEAIGTFLAAVTRGRPVVLLLDDLQWADAATLDLLCHVATHQTTARLLILGAYRLGEAEANFALTRAVDQLNRHRLLTAVTLSALTAEELSALATSYLGAPLDPNVGRVLYAHSEGNPFFAEELLRGWLEIGGLARQGPQWAATPALDPGTIPPGIVGAVHQRLTRLSPDAVADLQIAAILGRAFDFELLMAVERGDADAIESRLLTAARAGLVRIDRSGTYSFSHDKIRECVYAGISPARRQRLHLAIGRALKYRGESAGAPHLAALAFHFSRSGDRAQGVTYSLRAAEVALAVYAGREALAQYQTALDLMDAHDPRRGRTLLEMGKAALLADALTESLSAHEAACTWYLQAGDKIGAARALMETPWSRAGDMQKSIAAAERALGLLEDRPEPETVVVLTYLAEAKALWGRFPEAMTHAKRAREIARTLGNELLEADANVQLGKVVARMNDIPAGLELCERALAVLIAADVTRQAAWCCALIGFETLKAGMVRRCREVSVMRIELARRCHDPFMVRHAETWLAWVDSLEGNWAESEELISDVQTSEMTRFTEPMEFLHRARGFTALMRGDHADAERAFGEIVAIHEHGLKELTRYRGLLGLVQLITGKHHETQAYVATQEALLEALPAGSTAAAPILNCLAMIAVTMGDTERAARCREGLMPFQGQFHWFLVDRVLGMIEILRGDWPAAEAHLASAEAHAEREGLRPERALVLSAQADFELARGGPGSAQRARTKLGTALRRFQELGMTVEATRARKRLRDLPRQPGAPDHPFYPAGLSAREAQILRLVAAGLSNRAIARELSLSEKTVATHLTSIFNKTATDNRAAAVAFALRHGLA